MNISTEHRTLESLPPFYTAQCKLKAITADANDAGISLTLSDNSVSPVFSWFWLKDNGIDSASLNHDTLQREIDTFSIESTVTAQDWHFDKSNQTLHLTWQDGSNSIVSVYIMLSSANLCARRDKLVPDEQRIFWDHESPLSSIPTIKFDAVMDGDEGLHQWLKNIYLYGFSVVNGVPATESGTTLLAERIGSVQETIFGKMWRLSSHMAEHGDTAYSNDYLEPHTDATYYHDAAGLQMFNCLQYDATGGESLQVDGFAIARKIAKQDPQAYTTLCQTSVRGHYVEPGVHLQAERPVIRFNMDGELEQVSFNNYDRAPLWLPADKAEEFHRAYSLFHTHVNDPRNWLKIPLRPGTTLIFDNWRVLHGRMGFVGNRVFYGCYHSRATFESKLRVLQAGRSTAM